MTHRQVLLVLSGLMLGMFLAALDQTIVATALPTIAGDLGGLGHLSWVVTAYLLTSTASAPLYGKVSDLYGRKIVVQFAIVAFLIGSVLAGMSQSMGQLIIFRAIQGIGAGGLIVMAMTVVGDVLSPRERGRYQGYFGAVFALASVAGPLLGGFFVDNLSWRWVFYVNIPLGLLALVVVGVVLDLPFHRVAHPVDYLGSVLLVGGVSALLLVTVWGGSEYEWTSPMILALAGVGVLLILLFLLQERRAEEPLVPLRLFRDRTFTITSAGGFIVGLGMFGGIVFLPLFLQVVMGASPTNSGLLLTPLMAGIVIASTMSGRLISRTGRYKVFPLIGTSLMALGLWLLSTMDTETTVWQTSIYMLMLGLGVGQVLQVLVIAVQNAVDVRDLGIATSSATFFRSLGGSFGTALFGAILTSQLTSNLAGVLPAGADIAEMTASVDLIAQLPDEIRQAVVGVFSDAITTAFAVAVPIAIFALVLIIFLPERPLRDVAHVGGGQPEAITPPALGH